MAYQRVYQQLAADDSSCPPGQVYNAAFDKCMDAAGSAAQVAAHDVVVSKEPPISGGGLPSYAVIGLVAVGGLLLYRAMSRKK